MANKAISELPQADNVNNQDLFVLEQGGLAKKLTAETFITEQGIIDALAEALDGHGGIQSVTLQSLSGRVRTYLITFSDGSATTFQVLDGSTITNIQKTSTAGLVDTYTVYMSDGTTTFFQVRNGQDGSATWDQINSKAPIITETVTGAIANFPDGADDIPVADLVVNIESVQDLTYGNPYPAGGGTNLFNKDTVTNGKWLNLSTGAIENTSTNYSLSDYIPVKANTTYTMTNPNSSRRWAYDSSKNPYEQISSATYTPPVDGYILITISYDVSLNTFMVVKGSTLPSSYYPYSNICPVTGFTGANVYDDPKYGGMVDWNQLVVNGNFADGTTNWDKTNQLSLSASNNKLTATASSKSAYAYVHQGNIPTIPTGHKVLISSYVTLSQAEKIAYGNGTGIIATSSTLTANTRTQYWIVTTISSTPLARLVIYTGRTAGLDVGGTCTIEDVQVYDLTRIYGAGNEPSTFSSFSALFPNEFYDYNSGTVTCASAVNGDIYKRIQIDWTTEAGTVYGGSLDVTTGVLTVTDGYIASYAGETLPSTWISDRDVYSSGTTPTTGAQVVYALATPQTYQLTPQELATFFGTNNIFVDCGSTEVEYRADTKLYIEKLTMPTEDDMTANQAITNGKFFMVGNNLYIATAAIASGAKIIEGTNATRLSLADALNRL